MHLNSSWTALVVTPGYVTSLAAQKTAVALGILLKEIKAFKVKDTESNTCLACAHSLGILFKFDWYALRMIYLLLRQILLICRSVNYTNCTNVLRSYTVWVNLPNLATGPISAFSLHICALCILTTTIWKSFSQILPLSMSSWPSFWPAKLLGSGIFQPSVRLQTRCSEWSLMPKRDWVYNCGHTQICHDTSGSFVAICMEHE